MNSLALEQLTAALRLPRQLSHLLALAIIGLSIYDPAPAWGDQGEPLAVRLWPSGVVSVETHWDFEVVVDFYDSPSLPAELAEADLVISRPADRRDTLRLTLHASSSNDVGAGQRSESPVTADYPTAELELYLDRLANEAEQTLVAKDEATFVSKNALFITQLKQRLLLLVVDGVRVAIPLTDNFSDAADQLPIDALVVHGGPDAAGQRVSTTVVEQVQQLHPRWVILPAELAPLPAPSPTLAPGNTWCVATDTSAVETRPEDAQPPQTRWVQLQTSPWQMPAELLELWQRKEQACRDSQRIFATLSAAQMNFKPANGSHTPRWNSEHMMGRELLFFSQIYAQQNSQLRVMDLNPKQMPADYQPRHVDWDGGEEARQMERGNRFTRRFAYLLAGLELDVPAPGSAWTLRRLLEQMEKHYKAHTANVIKKFELADWPKD